MSELEDELIAKIKIMSDTIWDGKPSQTDINNWLDNFSDNTADIVKERLHALYLLSQFMYFSSREMRELLKSLYRDLYKYPIIQGIRRANNDTIDVDYINHEYAKELKNTRFLGVGNPSESGAHLLYYFRQENSLPKNLFINSHEIFDSITADGTQNFLDPVITRYVFIDDFCGSGNQAKKYSESLIQAIKNISTSVEVYYYVLFANKTGLDYVSTNTLFDRSDSIFKLDDTFKCFGSNSRHKPQDLPSIDWGFAYNTARKYGLRLWKDYPLGYDDGQLLIGFFHNTPDNALPIIWFDDPSNLAWNPIFRRYHKIYGDA